MKKIYMPSDDVLLKMQELGGDINTYLLIKAVESLIVDGVNYPNKGILKNAYKYLRENPKLVHAICLLYPEETKYSEVAKYDARLALDLVDKSTSREIYTLDNLSYFSSTATSNSDIVSHTIDKLYEKLPKSPEYRFEYKKSWLLEDIFSTQILNKMQFHDYRAMEHLSCIEPAYAVLIPNANNSDRNRTEYLKAMRENFVTYGIRAYARRYGLDQVEKREINLKSPDEETKRLIRCINHDKSNLY